MRISRRDVLVRAAAAGLVASGARAADALGLQSTSAAPLTFAMPAGACDCHAHAFGDPRQFPLAPERVYTPALATVGQMQAMHRAIHTDRVVIVQPSVYGTDNRCTLDAVRQHGSNARGVAVIAADTPDSTLGDLSRQGIRGIRVNLEQGGVVDPTIAGQRFRTAVDRAKAMNWHVQIYARLSLIASVADQVLTAPVPIVIDHFARATAAQGVSQPGFDAVLRAVGAGKAYVKLSAPYLNSTQAPDYADMAPIATALIAANNDRILWATDWPHVDGSVVAGRTPADIAPLFKVDDGVLLNQLAVWVPDAATRRKILVDNPARLYGF